MTIDQVLEAKKQNVKLLSDIELQEVNTTGPETPLEELFPMLADMKWPVAVVNENNGLLGIVPRVAILEALSRESNVEEVV